MFVSLLRRLLPPLVTGLILAALLLVLFPALRHGAQAPVKQVSFADAVRRAAPAVVNVYTSLACDEQVFEPRGLGSGVIMSTDGLILTNYHVIQQAENILIALQDQRIFQAQVLGSDPLTDLAVLRIEASQLPTIPLPATERNRRPQVGDLALAIGNPFNLGLSITQGIISATGRSGMSASGYQDFIQTDAAIHSGNSGGALVNHRGELLGINTAILGQGLPQGDIPRGIGFAIPLRLAMQVMQDLLIHGRVIRGYLGVQGVTLSTLPAGIAGNKGVLLTNVTPDSPASRAGLQANDVLLAIDGQPIVSAIQAQDTIADSPPGTRLTLQIWRQDHQRQLSVQIIEKHRPPRERDAGAKSFSACRAD